MIMDLRHSWIRTICDCGPSGFALEVKGDLHHCWMRRQRLMNWRRGDSDLVWTRGAAASGMVLGYFHC